MYQSAITYETSLVQVSDTTRPGTQGSTAVTMMGKCAWQQISLPHDRTSRTVDHTVELLITVNAGGSYGSAQDGGDRIKQGRRGTVGNAAGLFARKAKMADACFQHIYFSLQYM